MDGPIARSKKHVSNGLIMPDGRRWFFAERRFTDDKTNHRRDRSEHIPGEKKAVRLREVDNQKPPTIPAAMRKGTAGYCRWIRLNSAEGVGYDVDNHLLCNQIYDFIYHNANSSLERDKRGTRMTFIQVSPIMKPDSSSTEARNKGPASLAVSSPFQHPREIFPFSTYHSLPFTPAMLGPRFDIACCSSPSSVFLHFEASFLIDCQRSLWILPTDICIYRKNERPGPSAYGTFYFRLLRNCAAASTLHSLLRLANHDDDDRRPRKQTNAHITKMKTKRKKKKVSRLQVGISKPKPETRKLSKAQPRPTIHYLFL
ncbi:hypothetical protein L249_5054 [Ophiocordyceps polyrhachis-furcata BCC 54312]|uniref:Uncharacterized protein n=1 Tax=Ophiocordyceps polyrhachis-furcata BCC 54312 TaxID=1330021 RepID=A0A367L3G2_9HYPO|nr:hypothetical protein L249_5054 [Ophiocordyceps polyrhachis-furcata BCC 54312]